MIKDTIIKAYNFAEEAHRGQVRTFSGLDYFTHPKGVSRIVEGVIRDEKLIATALLHDVIEDTAHTFEDLEEHFGSDIANLVQELTSDSEIQRRMGKEIYLLQKMRNMTEGALLVKLADRLHNVLYLQGDTVTEKFIKKYYEETRFLMDNLKLQRSLLSIHKELMGKIEVILDFLEIRHKLS